MNILVYMQRPRDDPDEKNDENKKLGSTWFKIILLNLLITQIGRLFFPYFNGVLGVPLIGLYFILALFFTIVKHNVLSSHKPNTLLFVKDVLIYTLSMFTMYIINTLFSFKGNFTNSCFKWDFTNSCYKVNSVSYYVSEQHYVQSPLDQFEIRNLLSLDAPILVNLRIYLTNIRLYLTISAFIALVLNFLATNYNKVICNRWSVSQESIYATLNSIVINQINAKKGQMYFPFIYALFLFILINNLIGMIPYSFACTSHFSLTFFISFSVVLGATILGFIKHGLKFFSLFVPAGCPLALLPLLVLIEFISYLARNVSLGLRLAANILSGHMLLNILSGFAYNIMTSAFIYFFIGLIPLAFIIAFSGLELGIAFIQAQVFVVLTSSYIKDALDLH